MSCLVSRLSWSTFSRTLTMVLFNIKGSSSNTSSVSSIKNLFGAAWYRQQTSLNLGSMLLSMALVFPRWSVSGTSQAKPFKETNKSKQSSSVTFHDNKCRTISGSSARKTPMLKQVFYVIFQLASSAFLKQCALFLRDQSYICLIYLLGRWLKFMLCLEVSEVSRQHMNYVVWGQYFSF